MTYNTSNARISRADLFKGTVKRQTDSIVKLQQRVDEIEAQLKQIEAKTLERCARACEKMPYATNHGCATAIRKMKDWI